MQQVQMKKRADGINGAAVSAARRNDFDTAIDLWQKALQIYQELGLQAQEGNVLANIGVAYSLQGRFEEAQRWLEAALDKLLYPEDDDQKSWLANVYGTLGDIAARREQYAEAQTQIEKSLLLRREIGSQQFVARSLSSLGHICLAEKKYDEATALYQESLYVRSDANAPAEIVPALEGLADVIATRAKEASPTELIKAVRLFAAAHTIREYLGIAIPPCNQSEYDAGISALRYCTEEKAFSLAWGEGKAMSLEQAVKYALEN